MTVSAKTILLFGMPRSGTTWIAKILDSHPDTVYRHEPDAEISIQDLPWAPAIDDVPRYRDVVIKKVSSLGATRSGRVAGSRPAFPKSYLGPLRLEAYRAGIALNKLGERLWREFPVLFRPDPARPDRYPVVWKSIESLPRLPVLVRCLPDARAVVLVRHACGYVASVLRGEESKKFDTVGAASEDYGIFELLLPTPTARGYGLTMDEIRAATPVQRLAWRWVLTNEIAIRGVDGQPGCAVLSYESLCFDPLGGARKLLNLAGLTWSSQTEDFVRDSTASEHSAYYSLIKDPKRSATKWKTQLTAEQISQIESVVDRSSLRGLVK